MSISKSKFRTLLLIIAVLLLFSTFMSFAQSTVKLRVVTYFTGEDPFSPAWKDAMALFKQKYPNVEIIDEAVPTANDAIRTKVKTDFATDNEPDVMFFFTGADAIPLLKTGKIYAWDEEIEKDKKWSDNFNKAALKFTTYKGDIKEYDGKIYALPTIGFYEGLFVNKDLFEKYNLALPTDWNKFTKAISILKSRNIIPIAGSILESYYLIETFILSAGGPEGHDTPFHPSWETGLNYIKQVYKLGAFPKDALTIKDDQARELFYTKKAGMMVNGSWCVGGLKDKENTVIMPLPVVPGGKAHPTDIIGGFGSGWYVSKKANAEKKGLPVEFVKFMTSPEIVAKFVSIAGVPAVKVNLTGLSPAAKSGFDMMAKARAICMPIDAQIVPEAFTKIRLGLSYVVTEERSAKDLLKEAKEIHERAQK
jgi:raffinose/stachyose/melibiose transport system substrate-binding protein